MELRTTFTRFFSLSVLALALGACATTPSPSAVPTAPVVNVTGFAADLQALGVTVEQEGAITVITLPDSAGVTAQGVGGNAFAALKRIAQHLTQTPTDGARIGGHTDGDQRLSEQKAQSVANALVQLGINPGRLQAVGYGARFPLGSLETPEGRTQSQRVEIEISRMK